MHGSRLVALPLVVLLGFLSQHVLGAAAPAPSLVGTWVLTAADKILPDGSRVEDYGNAPQGLAIFTAEGYYSVSIYRADGRLRFASNDKASGTPDEYRHASLSTSAHFGTYDVDAATRTLTFRVERAAFPNWDGTRRAATFTLVGDTLSWTSPARPDGTIPVSVFRRVTPAVRP